MLTRRHWAGQACGSADYDTCATGPGTGPVPWQKSTSVSMRWFFLAWHSMRCRLLGCLDSVIEANDAILQCSVVVR